MFHQSSDPSTSPVEDTPPRLRRLADLVSPYGLVSTTAPLRGSDGEPDFAIQVASLGKLASVFPHLSEWSEDPDLGNVNGVGTALSPLRARMIAVAEALERYSACRWNPSALRWASEQELLAAGVDLISPSRWPQCSIKEFANPACALTPYDPSVPIRWVDGWSVTRGCPLLVPAITVYLNMPYASESERFIRTVSTGAAVHSTLEEAVLGGLLEVVERDALTIAWLRSLRLPFLAVEPDSLSPNAREYVRRGTTTNLQVQLFDATTDFGIPVIYALQTSDCDDLAQVLCATCDLDPGQGVAKVFRELAALRIPLRHRLTTGPAERPAEGQVSVVGTAAHAAHPSRRWMFDHLVGTDGRSTHTVDELASRRGRATSLAEAVSSLARCGAETIVVDLTTDEARQVGMHAVRVLVPEAVPLSFVHSERYLATPRLYSAPLRMGYPASGTSINPLPHPFA